MRPSSARASSATRFTRSRASTRRRSKAAGFEWSDEEAHSALYDAQMTGELFCAIVNRFRPIYESSRLDAG